MEVFEFDNIENGTMIICKKRNLYISCFFIHFIPDQHPDDAIFCFSTFQPIPGSNLPQDRPSYMAFGINDPEDIHYEPLLKARLIHVAIDTFCKACLRQEIGEVSFTPSYEKMFIDTKPTDLDNLSPEMHDFIISGEFDKGADFYEWKDIKHQAALN
jgi:hypothetical protein